MKEPIEIVPPNPDINILESDFHTLISTDIPVELVPLSDPDGNILENLFEQRSAYVKHKLFLDSFEDMSGHGLHKITNKLQEADPDDLLEIHISSYGGNFDEVVQIHNLINSMYSDRCTTYMSYGRSGGALAFMMGNTRIIYKHSNIMFHFFSGFEDGKGSDMLASLKHGIKTISAYYREILSEYFTDKELTLMIKMGKEYWMDSAKMMNRGVATGIIVDGEYLTSEIYFSRYNKKGNLRKSYIKKLKKLEKSEQLKET